MKYYALQDLICDQDLWLHSYSYFIFSYNHLHFKSSIKTLKGFIYALKG